MALISIQVNGETHKVEAEENTPVLWILRDTLKLHGTRFGCGIGMCGACTIHLNGAPVRSCLMPIASVSNAEITTIEGLAKNGAHPVQKAWEEQDVSQCGYCQSGQIMSAAALINKNPNPSTTEIKQAMTGNICRCGTYSRIIKAIKSVSGK